MRLVKRVMAIYLINKQECFNNIGFLYLEENSISITVKMILDISSFIHYKELLFKLKTPIPLMHMGSNTYILYQLYLVHK
jgi:hypothetical protein